MKIKELKEEHPAIYKIAMNYLRQLPLGIIDQANPDMDDFNWHKTSEGFTFWCSIENGNFQVFYERYPEHSKQPVNLEEKDWSKATDEELIAEAKRRFPKGVEFFYPWNMNIKNRVSSGDFTFEYGNVFDVKTRSCVYLVDRKDWAEVIEPNEEQPEPKAGDMVEYSDDAIRWEGNLRYTGGKTSSGLYIVEENDVTLCFKHIRIPQKSEVESKVKELLVNVREGHYNHVGDQHMITKKWLIEKMIEIVKWGQQNTNAK